MTEAFFGVIRNVLALLPIMLTVWGWAEWIENPGTSQRGMREYAIGAGLGAALIASLCFAKGEFCSTEQPGAAVPTCLYLYVQ